MGEPIALARIACNVTVAIAEAADIGGKALIAEFAGDLLREPHDRILLPSGGVDGVAVALHGVELGLVVPERRFFVLENSGIVAHQRQRDFEGRGWADLLVAAAVTAERGAAAGVDDQGALQHRLQGGIRRKGLRCRQGPSGKHGSCKDREETIVAGHWRDILCRLADKAYESQLSRI